MYENPGGHGLPLLPAADAHGCYLTKTVVTFLVSFNFIVYLFTIQVALARRLRSSTVIDQIKQLPVCSKTAVTNKHDFTPGVHGICTLSRNMTSFRSFENLIMLYKIMVRVRIRVRAGISGITFSVKRVFEQV